MRSLRLLCLLGSLSAILAVCLPGRRASAQLGDNVTLDDGQDVSLRGFVGENFDKHPILHTKVPYWLRDPDVPPKFGHVNPRTNYFELLERLQGEPDPSSQLNLDLEKHRGEVVSVLGTLVLRREDGKISGAAVLVKWVTFADGSRSYPGKKGKVELR